MGSWINTSFAFRQTIWYSCLVISWLLNLLVSGGLRLFLLYRVELIVWCLKCPMGECHWGQIYFAPATRVLICTWSQLWNALVLHSGLVRSQIHTALSALQSWVYGLATEVPQQENIDRVKYILDQPCMSLNVHGPHYKVVLCCILTWSEVRYIPSSSLASGRPPDIHVEWLVGYLTLGLKGLSPLTLSAFCSIGFITRHLGMPTEPSILGPALHESQFVLGFLL